MSPSSSSSLAAFALVSLLASCGPKESSATPQADERPTIATVNYPLAYFAERLAGDFATILFEAPADEDPAFWTPNDDQLNRIQNADLILLNGAGYAKWTASTTLPFTATVDTSVSFSDEFIEQEETVKHTHGQSEEEHSHAGTAFTTWLDLEQAAAQATAVAEAIAEEWPEEKDQVMGNLSVLLTDLQDVHGAMKSVTASLGDAPLIASHPVYQYWARAYGLTVPSLLWEPEMDLTDEAMADLRKLQESHPDAKLFVWEGEPAPGHAEKLEAAGLASVVVSPAGNRPENGDFLSVMRENVTALEALAE